jgi:hypothetical protein
MGERREGERNSGRERGRDNLTVATLVTGYKVQTTVLLWLLGDRV